MQISQRRASLSSKKPAHLVQRACNDRLCLFCASCARSVAAIALIFKILHAKSREFRPQNCAISVLNVRKACKKSAQKQAGCLLRRVAHILTFCEVFASAGRVLRAKSAPKLIENFGISIDNREFWLQNSRQKTPQISGKAWNGV